MQNAKLDEAQDGIKIAGRNINKVRYADYTTLWQKDLPGGTDGKASAYNAGDPGSIPGKISWRRKWKATPVFLPGKSHGWRSLVGYSPWGCKELDTTE